LEGDLTESTELAVPALSPTKEEHPKDQPLPEQPKQSSYIPQTNLVENPPSNLVLGTYQFDPVQMSLTSAVPVADIFVSLYATLF
jgi:hypothetical protein